MTAAQERRLAAILAADIVGYSRLIEADEAGTLAAVGGLWREVLMPVVRERHGRVAKSMGDGAIVEFASVAAQGERLGRGPRQGHRRSGQAGAARGPPDLARWDEGLRRAGLPP